MSLFPADYERLRELILHVSQRCRDWERFDSAMLDRLLFQADFQHFLRYGFPITGQAYRRGILSPAPRSMRPVLRDMIAAGSLEIVEVQHPDGLHARCLPRALREPNLRIFDGREIALVETVILFYRRTWDPDTGEDMLILPWEAARPREEIPYQLALLGSLSNSSAGSDRYGQTGLHGTARPVLSHDMRKLAQHSLILAS
ncbi:MAG: hypothetical protein ABI036_08760 [Fibrobacteria bacterium]